MDQPPKPSLADDPAFLASLAALDLGLTERPDAASTNAPKPPTHRAATAARVAGPSTRQPPRPPAAAPPPQPLAPLTLPDRIPPPPGGRRPLLDLFPPPSSSYETFDGLQEKPFSLSTDPQFLYHSASHDRAAQDLLSAIRRRDGLVVLTGEVGVGKTILCRAIVDELDRRTLTSLVLDPFLSIEQLLQTLLLDFGVISRDDVARGLLAHTSRDELFAKLREFLDSLHHLQAFAVVLIDEAQNLSIAMLGEIGALLDLDAHRRLLQVVLVGEPSLTTLLGRPEAHSLSHRVALRSAIEPLHADEVAEYVAHRLAVANSRARVELDEPAQAVLFAVTAGVPRAVNLVCDRALALGHDAAASVIDQTLILAAAHDLDVTPPARDGRHLLHVITLAAGFLALVGVGAGAAALVFRAPLSRTIVGWESIPPPPRSPTLRMPAPLAPAPAPPTTVVPAQPARP